MPTPQASGREEGITQIVHISARVLCRKSLRQLRKGLLPPVPTRPSSDRHIFGAGCTHRREGRAIRTAGFRGVDYIACISQVPRRISSKGQSNKARSSVT